MALSADAVAEIEEAVAEIHAGRIEAAKGLLDLLAAIASNFNRRAPKTSCEGGVSASRRAGVAPEAE